MDSRAEKELHRLYHRVKPYFRGNNLPIVNTLKNIQIWHIVVSHIDPTCRHKKQQGKNPRQ